MLLWFTFEKPENNQEIKIEIRHSEKTVKIFTHPELEKQLTKVVGDKSIFKAIFVII